MSHFVELICPRCQQTVSEERTSEDVIVCNHCGYTHDRREAELEARHERRFSMIVFVGALIALAGFIQFVHWDTYSFEIIPLKVKEWTNTANSQELRKIADICRDRMIYSCTENALSEILQKNPNDLSSLEELAELQRLLGESAPAMQNFKSYFAQGGSDPAADFSYARLLDAAGQYADAQVYYQRTLLAKPAVIQVTVIQSYVSMLMKTHQIKEAIALIDDVRKHNGPEGKEFMAQEYNQITGRL